LVGFVLEQLHLLVAQVVADVAPVLL
jgi:hypothetical protein